MKLPVIGPLLFLPASAAAAFLADFLHRQPRNAQFLAGVVGPATGLAAAGGSSVLPVDVAPPGSAAGRSWGLGSRKRQTTAGQPPATRPAVPPAADAGKQQ